MLPLLDQPITWGDYWLGNVLGYLFGLLLVAMLSTIAAVQKHGRCATCDRKRQFRMKKPHPLASRWACPFCDE